MTLPVADQQEISGLVHRYAGYVDARRFREVAELFTADAELVLPDPPDHLHPCVRHSGHAGVREAMSALAAITRTHHGIVGEIYESSGDKDVPPDAVTGEIAAVAHHWVANGGQFTDHVWYLRYSDTYLRVEQGWRIAARALSIDAIESAPARQVRS